MIRTIAILTLAAAAGFAQGPRGPQNPNAPNHPASALDMTRLKTLTGPVSAVNIAYGTQYPSISVNQAVIKVAPVWFFLAQGFEMKAGDVVTVVAAPSLLPNDSYLYAIEISSEANKARIVLRDQAGVPLWTGPAAGRGNSATPRTGTGTGCVDAASIVTATGAIEKLTMGVGIQMPALVLKTEGKLVTIKLGPERTLLEADLELQEGQSITVRYGTASCTGEYVALQLVNAAGVTVTLRSDDGTPAWN